MKNNSVLKNVDNCSNCRKQNRIKSMRKNQMITHCCVRWQPTSTRHAYFKLENAFSRSLFFRTDTVDPRSRVPRGVFEVCSFQRPTQLNWSHTRAVYLHERKRMREVRKEVGKEVFLCFQQRAFCMCTSFQNFLFFFN